MTNGAGTPWLNLAARLEDGEQDFVPEMAQQGETIDPEDAVFTGSGFRMVSAGLVSINRASLEELDTLPGIDPATFERIKDLIVLRP